MGNNKTGKSHPPQSCCGFVLLTRKISYARFLEIMQWSLGQKGMMLGRDKKTRVSCSSA